MSEATSGSPRHVAVGGTGRSGTNLLKQILSEHSQVHTLPFEHRFVIDPGGVIDFYHGFADSWSPFVADRKLRDLERYLLRLARRSPLREAVGTLFTLLDRSGRFLVPPSYQGWELERWFPGYEARVRALIEELQEFEYRGRWPGSSGPAIGGRVRFAPFASRAALAPVLGRFVNDCVNAALSRAGKNCFVEDNTWNILFATDLLALSPNLKLVHVIRDPRDVVASFTRQPWCPDDLAQAATYYRSIVAKWRSVRPDLPATRWLEIRLEDLIRSPRKAISGLLDSPD